MEGEIGSGAGPLLDYIQRGGEQRECHGFSDPLARKLHQVVFEHGFRPDAYLPGEESLVCPLLVPSFFPCSSACLLHGSHGDVRLSLSAPW